MDLRRARSIKGVVQYTRKETQESTATQTQKAHETGTKRVKKQLQTSTQSYSHQRREEKVPAGWPGCSWSPVSDVPCCCMSWSRDCPSVPHHLFAEEEDTVCSASSVQGMTSFHCGAWRHAGQYRWAWEAAASGIGHLARNPHGWGRTSRQEGAHPGRQGPSCQGKGTWVVGAVLSLRWGPWCWLCRDRWTAAVRNQRRARVVGMEICQHWGCWC